MDLTPLSPTELDFDVELTAPELKAHQMTVLEPGPIIGHIEDRFGFAKNLFDELVFLQVSHKVIRAASPPLALPGALDVDRAGIDFLRIDMANPRLTTSAAMTWGRYAVTNVVDTDRRQCDTYVRREPLSLDAEQLDFCTGRGFVIIRHLGHGLGIGFLESTRPDDSNFAHVRSMYPGAFSAEIEHTSPFGNPS